MRPTLHGDVSCAARVLLLVPRKARERICRRMICEAEIADRYRVRNQRLHPRFGNGSLMSVARKRPMLPEPFFDDPEYCECYETVLRVLRLYWLSRPHTLHIVPQSG